MLKIIRDEVDTPFYFDVHKLCKQKKLTPPKLEILISGLRINGFRVSRTHFCLTGLKTDASEKKIIRLIMKNQ